MIKNQTDSRNLYHRNLPVNQWLNRAAQFDLQIFHRYYRLAKEWLQDQYVPVHTLLKKADGKRRFYLDREPYGANDKLWEDVVRKLFEHEEDEVYAQFNGRKHLEKLRISSRDEVEEYIVVNFWPEKEREEEEGSEQEKGEQSKKEKDKPIPWTFCIGPNTYQLERTMEAIRNLQNAPLPTHRPLYELFTAPSHAFSKSPKAVTISSWKVLDDESFEGTDQQRAFVETALATPDFALLEGPPGSGKTRTIIELILQLAERGKRVLLVSATHVAVDNVIARLVDDFAETSREMVVPVRVASRKRSITDERVAPFHLGSLIQKHKDELKKYLAGNQQFTSQKYLKEALDGDDNRYLNRVILDSANLIAGTMVGILKHPDFKGTSLNQYFDVMIVDEASKVTFGEFLIPALYAKKWILVGDTKQLSPYVEGDYVEEYLRAQGPALNEQELLARTVQLRANLDQDRLKVYFSETIEQEDLEAQFQLDDPREEPLVVTEFSPTLASSPKGLLALNASDVLLVRPRKLNPRLLREALYVPAEFHGAIPSDFSEGIRQRGFPDSRRRYLFPSGKEDWPQLMASQLDQYYSFRSNPKDFVEIKKQLDLLIGGLEEVERIVAEMKRVPFPSILEILQQGCDPVEDQRRPKVFTHGLSEAAKETRFVSLTYQHRMHPDIAATSRKFFYEGQNLESPERNSEKEWGYLPQEDRVRWIPDRDRTGSARRRGKKKMPIINPTECRHMMEELDRFLEFALQEGTREVYEVAILTFYRNQEWELRRALAWKWNIRPKRRVFQKEKVQVRICTVDRFQGQEADLVMLGFTKTSPYAHYNSPNRLNVALTRARDKLLLFGNSHWLAQKAKSKALRHLAENYGSRMTYATNPNSTPKKRKR